MLQVIRFVWCLAVGLGMVNVGRMENLEKELSIRIGLTTENNRIALECSIENPKLTSSVQLACPILPEPRSCFQECRPSCQVGDGCNNAGRELNSIQCDRHYNAEKNVLTLLYWINPEHRATIGNWYCSHVGMKSSLLEVKEQLLLDLNRKKTVENITPANSSNHLPQTTAMHFPTGGRHSVEMNLKDASASTRNMDIIALTQGADEDYSPLTRAGFVLGVIIFLLLSLLFNILFCLRCLLKQRIAGKTEYKYSWLHRWFCLQWDWHEPAPRDSPPMHHNRRPSLNLLSHTPDPAEIPLYFLNDDSVRLSHQTSFSSAVSPVTQRSLLMPCAVYRDQFGNPLYTVPLPLTPDVEATRRHASSNSLMEMHGICSSARDLNYSMHHPLLSPQLPNRILAPYGYNTTGRLWNHDSDTGKRASPQQPPRLIRRTSLRQNGAHVPITPLLSHNQLPSVYSSRPRLEEENSTMDVPPVPPPLPPPPGSRLEMSRTLLQKADTLLREAGTLLHKPATVQSLDQ